MPLSRTQKETVVEDYLQGLATAPHVFLMDFRGLDVPQVTELRSRIRETGGRYQVVKNRLALRAIEGAALGELKEHFRGPTAVVYGDSDPIALAKVLTDFAKTRPSIEFKAGLLDGQQVAGEQIREIATVPSREALLAKLLFLMQSPVTRFARVLGAIPQQFVTALDQVRQSKEKDASTD